MLILVKTPFTEFVPGEGMVVGNMGRIVSLPDKMAGNRIEGGFGEESTQEAFDEQEAADAELEAAAIEATMQIYIQSGMPADEIFDKLADAGLPKPRGKRGQNKPRTPKAAASPVDAPVA